MSTMMRRTLRCLLVFAVVASLSMALSPRAAFSSPYHSALSIPVVAHGPVMAAHCDNQGCRGNTCVSGPTANCHIASGSGNCSSQPC